MLNCDQCDEWSYTGYDMPLATIMEEGPSLHSNVTVRRKQTKKKFSVIENDQHGRDKCKEKDIVYTLQFQNEVNIETENKEFNTEHFLDICNQYFHDVNKWDWGKKH